MSNENNRDTGNTDQDLPLFDVEARRKLKCGEIQEHLVAYLTHDLGEARTVIVREHLRKCQDCTDALNDIQTAFEALQKTKHLDADIPAHLSEEERSVVFTAVSSPLNNWLDRHHRLIAIIVTVLIFGVVLLLLSRLRVSLYPEGEEVQVIIMQKTPATGVPHGQGGKLP